MARLIALTALTTLGLTEAPVHEPVHGHHCERLMATTERYHAPREIRQLVCHPGHALAVHAASRIGHSAPGIWDLGPIIEGLSYCQSGGLRPSSWVLAIGWRRSGTRSAW